MIHYTSVWIGLWVRGFATGYLLCKRLAPPHRVNHKERMMTVKGNVKNNQVFLQNEGKQYRTIKKMTVKLSCEWSPSVEDSPIIWRNSVHFTDIITECVWTNRDWSVSLSKANEGRDWDLPLLLCLTEGRALFNSFFENLYLWHYFPVTSISLMLSFHILNGPNKKMSFHLPPAHSRLTWGSPS